MSMIASPPGVVRHAAPAILTLLVALAALVLLLAPQPAKANVVCSLTTQPVTINFGTSLTASGDIRYTCRSFNTTPTTFTICTGIGNPSFPGTAAQPKLQSGANTLDFNLYVDPAATIAWTKTLPIAQTATVAAGATISGTLTFYGRIPAGQSSPVGTYQAFFFNTVLGFLAAGSQTCVSQLNDLSGLDFSINVTANLAEACNLGIIEAVDFGAPAGFWTEVDAVGSVQVTCPAATSWTLSFDGGQYLDGSERRMRSAGGDYVPYRLYRDTARSQLIPIDGTILGTGTGTVQSNPVYGRVTVAMPPPVGSYSDTVTVVLHF